MAAQRPSIFACLTQSARSASLPPPALRERSHGVLASRGVAVRGRAVFMVAEGERPHPRASDRRCVYFEDAADHQAIGNHVKVVLSPLARGTARRCALEDQIVFFHLPSRTLSCWVIISIKALVLKERTLPAGFIAPCLPTKTERPPSGEVKLLAKFGWGQTLTL